MPKLEQFPLDRRLREINLKRGRLTQENITKHLQSLPDSSGEAEELIIQDEDTVDEATTEEGDVNT